MHQTYRVAVNLHPSIWTSAQQHLDVQQPKRYEICELSCPDSCTMFSLPTTCCALVVHRHLGSDRHAGRQDSRKSRHTAFSFLQQSVHELETYCAKLPL